MANFHRGVPGARKTEQISRFRASWDGECVTCGESIWEGDDIGYIGRDAEGVSCDECITEAQSKSDG